MEDKKKQIKSKQEKSSRKYSVNIPKFCLFIGIILFIIAIVIVTIFFVNKKEKVDSGTDISKLNAKKYTTELLNEYNKDGMKEKFLTDYDAIQTSIGMYILNNSTLEKDSFSKLSENINTELVTNDWSKVGAYRPQEWNGNWSVDNTGALKFRFALKEIEPNWSLDKDFTNKIILN
ncbi:MAG: hypothetical protein RSE00_05270 [Clostridia bacterium]